MVISSVVTNAVALMKNHLPNLDMEILLKDFTVNDAERETLVNSTYDAAHDFVSLYDFPALLNPMIIIVPTFVILLLYVVITFFLVDKTLT
jgi:hypothetical protein